MKQTNRYNLFTGLLTFCCHWLICLVTVNSSAMAAMYDPATAPLDLWMYLPGQWLDMCTVNYDVDPEVNATISCTPTQSDRAKWRLADFRAALSPLMEREQYEVAVDLRCREGAIISLPHPMRAPGLVKLSVFNCHITDKYADFLSDQAYMLNDYLRVQDMRDCTWLVDLDSYLNVTDNHSSITSDDECGQDSTLKIIISRNISVEILEQRNVHNLLNLHQWADDEGPQNDSIDSKHYGVQLSGHISQSQQALEGQRGKAGRCKGQGHSPVASEDFLQTMIDLGAIQVPCDFPNLEIYDSSFTLNIAHNEFELLVRDTTFPKLRVLNFTATGLTSVPREVAESRRKFSGSKLGVIDLSHNCIQQVGPLYRWPSGGLSTTLVLQYNNITQISMPMFEEWAQVPDYFVDIRNNPIDCNCDFQDLLVNMRNASKWASQAMAYYRRHLSVMRCATPPQLSGARIEDLQLQDLPCPVVRQDLWPALAAVLVIMWILLVMLVLGIKYRKEVRILMYTRVHILLPCGMSSQPPFQAEKIYDAFVAYAHPDSDWVLGSLLPHLEEPSHPRGCRPCKLCVHQRDFVVGKPIIDNIVDSIATSRHTIVILSRSFVQSSWAMEELHQAYRQSLEERRRHLVLVMLEDVEESSMAPVLRRCCKTFTYLHVSDSFFWDRLLYSLHTTERDNGEKITGTPSDSHSITMDSCDTPCQGEENSSKGDNDKTSLGNDFRKMIFEESMRTLSVDSACSALSDTHVAVSPSQFSMGKTFFA